MQRRAFHAHELGGARNVAAEPVDLRDQVFALEYFARVAQRQPHQGLAAVASLVARSADAVVTVSEPIAELSTALVDLKKALTDHSAESAYDEALHARDALLPAMDAVRAPTDTLEGVVADDLWPLPTYQEMLYIL